MLPSRRRVAPLPKGFPSFLFAAGFAFAFLQAGMVGAAGSPEGRLEVRLKARAETDSAVVRLRDIVEPTTELTDNVQRTIVGLLPPDGRPLQLQRQAIHTRLSEVFGRTAPVVTGPDRVVVRRIVKTAPAESPSQPRVTESQLEKPKAVESRSDARKQPVTVNPQLDAKLRELITDALGGREALWEGVPQWTRESVAAFAASDTRLNRVEPTETLQEGTQLFRVEYRADRESREVMVPVQLTAAPYGLAAAVSLRRGEIIRASQLKKRALSARSAVSGMTTDAGAFVGKEVKQNIPAGSWVTEDKVGPITLVRRGDNVVVRVIAGGVVVETNGRALEDGASGDLLAVETETTRNNIYARVADNGVLEIVTRPPLVSERMIR